MRRKIREKVSVNLDPAHKIRVYDRQRRTVCLILGRIKGDRKMFVRWGERRSRIVDSVLRTRLKGGLRLVSPHTQNIFQSQHWIRIQCQHTLNCGIPQHAPLERDSFVPWTQMTPIMRLFWLLVSSGFKYEFSFLIPHAYTLVWALANIYALSIHILTLSSLLESPIRTWHAIPRVLESENVYRARINVR